VGIGVKRGMRGEAVRGATSKKIESDGPMTTSL
jgi:hypothetical protein